jgi:hypothetical protein
MRLDIVSAVIGGLIVNFVTEVITLLIKLAL